MTVTHSMAVQRLRAAGNDQAASELAAYRSAHGDHKGWDGWLRKRFRQLVAIVWPEA
jgi:hypothetical protein